MAGQYNISEVKGSRIIRKQKLDKSITDSREPKQAKTERRHGKLPPESSPEEHFTRRLMWKAIEEFGVWVMGI